MNKLILNLIKKSSYALCLIFNFNAFAEIKVGDEALFRISYAPDVTGYSYRQLEVIKVDHNVGTYEYKETFYSGSTVLYELTKTDRLANIRTMASNFANCEISQIGKYETINVPAGSFKTCHVSFRPIPSMDPDEYYFADVPFGIVKKSFIISSASGITMEEELMSFTKQ
jgi:hypothetical protein